MINTYNLFTTVVIHGKIPIQPQLHKKILNYVDEAIISSPTSIKSIVNGHQIYNNFDGKKELDDILNNYFSNFFGLKIVNNWLNILSNHSYNRPHFHGGNGVCSSAVFYLSNKNNNITFTKGSEIFEIKPKLFDFILFPFDLVHYVLPEERSEPRICYSLNLEMVNGE